MNIQPLIMMMYNYYSGDSHQIQHFIKVHSFARQIGIMENLDEITQEILEISAIVHDIGIKNSMEKYGSGDGKYQELEGPPEAMKMLTKLKYPQNIIDRVCYLVGHHHTYNEIEGMDYQILVEADFLVNIHESNMDAGSIKSVIRKIFKTSTGIQICKRMFKVEESPQ